MELQAGLVSRAAIWRRYWHGVDKELVERGVIAPAGDLKTQTFRIVKPLPENIALRDSIAEPYIHPVETWLDAVKTELSDILSEVRDWQKDLKEAAEDEQAAALEEIIDELTDTTETFPWETPEPWGSHAVQVDPMDLVVTFKHWQKKPSDSYRARLTECGSVVRTLSEDLVRWVDCEATRELKRNFGLLLRTFKRLDLE